MKLAGHLFNSEKAGRLLDPKRKEYIAPEQVMSLLKINKNDVIADLGAGNGYFTVPIAKETTTNVYAIDVQDDMLQLLKKHARHEKVDNIEYILGDVEETSLPSQSVDKGIMAFVYHEVANPDAVLREIQRILKPDGKFLIVEWEAVESEIGPPLNERIPSKKLLEYINTRFKQTDLISFHSSVYGILINN